VQHLRSEGECGQNIIPRDVRIIPGDGIERPAIGQPAEYELDGDTRALDNWPTAQDFRIAPDTLSPIHK